MADWFKFYENSIDEPRFATAITELPEVLPVFVLILSEHCKHKSPTVSWSGDDYELKGFARKLGISVERFNAALALLNVIQYITIADGQLTTLKWNDLQSNYCQKKARPPKQSVRTLSAHSTDTVRQEERRGEEIREIREEEIKTLSPLAQKVGGWFNRRASTHWSPKELKLMKQVESFKTSPEDISLLESFYTSDAPFKRQDIATLLNNWNGEIDRARGWKSGRNSQTAQKPKVDYTKGF